MHLFDLQLDPRRLVRFAAAHGHNRLQDDDHGYATHAWLKACFSDLAPKTHRLFEQRDGRLRMLGYTRTNKSRLYEHANLYADPVTAEVANWESLATKEMPRDWRVEQRLGFEVRACPVVRGHGVERDAYVASVSRAEGAQPVRIAREEAYAKWLERQFQPAAAIVSLQLMGFRRVRGLRRGHRSGGQATSYHAIDRPDALFAGTLEVREPELFAALLDRGIGRHRAFGFGMLLLRPPRVFPLPPTAAGIVCPTGGDRPIEAGTDF